MSNCSLTLQRAQHLFPSRGGKTREVHGDATVTAGTRDVEGKLGWRQEWKDRLLYWLNRTELRDVLKELETKKSTLRFSVEVLGLQRVVAYRDFLGPRSGFLTA